MPITNFPNGASSFGMPVLPGVAPTTGSIFFVHSGTGGSGADGLSPTTPLATVDQAINKCTASKGDTIFVMPGHSETIAAADGWDADVAGIRIIGLGWGALRPTFNFTATASTVAIGANNVWVENLRFAAGVSAVVAGVIVEGKTDTTFVNCEWHWGDTTAWDFVISLSLTAGSHRTRVLGCKFIAEPGVAGASTAVKLTGASNNCEINGNFFGGDYSLACVNGITTLSKELLFLNNTVHNLDSGEPYLEVLTGTTGVIANTRGLASAATIAANAVADAMAHCENFVVNTAGTAAVLLGAGGSPAADTD
jgi:hypothetical protein